MPCRCPLALCQRDGIGTQHPNAIPGIEGKSLGTVHRGAEGLGLLFRKGRLRAMVAEGG